MPFDESAGRVTTESISFYPLGSLSSCRGEVITEELIAYARLMQEKKLLVSGPQDPSLRNRGHKMKKGLFITLEGPDGSGKTTQAKRLKAYLETKGREVVLTREPGGTGLAETLRSLALSPEITMSKRVESLLHVAARADHVDKVIRPALEAGKVVICDRFSDSTLIYQGILGGMDLDELERLSLFGSKGLSPDVTLLIDGNPRVLLSRREASGRYG